MDGVKSLSENGILCVHVTGYKRGYKLWYKIYKWRHTIYKLYRSIYKLHQSFGYLVGTPREQAGVAGDGEWMDER